jgi:hydrogenase expression/formation protein HypE
MAVLAQRESLEIEGEIRSDTQALHRLVAAMLAAGETHALRDPTRGGLGTSLCEIADASQVGVEIDARAVPVRGEVRGACELLGIDPLFVANEGKLVAFAAPDAADAVLAAMRATEEGRDAVAIGRAVETHPGMVVMKTEIGGTRIIELPFHEQLPRIC